jgi:predicted ATP-dependent endonuclease of OLD family
VWTWREHVEAARLKNTPPSSSLVVLLDEVEAHLHPQWQRVLLPALLRVARELSGDVQLFATTHAPLVLASLESHFDDGQDALFHLDLEEGEVGVSKIPWALRSDVSLWFTKAMFDPGYDVVSSPRPSSVR